MGSDSAGRKGLNRSADALLKAARLSFACRGFGCVSSREICMLAELNSAAIHYHFGSFGNLEDAVVESLLAWRVDSARNAAAAVEMCHAQLPVIDRFRASLQAWLRSWQRDSDDLSAVQLHRLWVHAQARAVSQGASLTSPDLQQVEQDLEAKLVNSLVKAARSKHGFLSMVQGAYLSQCLEAGLHRDLDGRDLESIADSVVDWISPATNGTAIAR